MVILINLQNVFSKWLLKLYSNFSNIISDKNKFFDHLGYDLKKKFSCSSVISKEPMMILQIYNLDYENENIDDKNIFSKYWVDISLNKDDIIECITQ